MVLDRLASAQGRRDEELNQEFARDLAKSEDKDAIKTLVENLNNKDRGIQSDCIKVLYEIGEIKPNLIAAYADEFIDILQHKNNRLVWGAMTALGHIAPIQSATIAKRITEIIDATDKGSVITQDWGIRTLAICVKEQPQVSSTVFPYLTAFLKGCRPKDLPRHSESVLVALTADNQAEVRAILQARLSTLKTSQAKRVQKVLNQLDAL